MDSSLIPLPDLHTLTQSFNAAFHDDKPITILAREPNPLKSTFQSEIVACQLADGRQLRLLCKYAAGYSHNAYGHRGGISYEANVYRTVLNTAPVSIPTFYGLHEDPVTGQAWFILEYIDDCMQVKDSLEPIMMPAAARWLGRFHVFNATCLLSDSMPFLKKYNADYYLGWAKRTSQLAGNLHDQFPWLAVLCRRFEDVIEVLLEPPATIVHGEYYPENVLFCQGVIYPVDWEAAAIARGEIDLASLTEDWPANLVNKSIAAYQSVHWPEGPPADFERRFDVAQLYWCFRWLGERSDWTHQEAGIKRFEKLGSLGERLDLI